MIELTATRQASVVSLGVIYILLALSLFFWGSNHLIYLSVLLFVCTLTLSLFVLGQRYALLNPVYVFCLLQLSLYSLNWLPFLFVVNPSNDTYGSVGLDTQSVKDAIVALNMLTSLWLACAVLGNFAWRVKTSWRAADVGLNYRSVALAIIAIAIGSFVVLVGEAGSLFELMIQREMTREDRLAADIGRHWFAFAQMGVLGVALWGFSDVKAFKSRLFLPLFILVLLIGFMVSGNRTSIVMSCLLIYAAWAFRSKRLFSSNVLVLSGVLVIGLGFASVVREEGVSKLQASGYDPSAQEVGLFEKLIRLRSERAVEGSASLGILMALKQDMPYLLGESYRSIAYIPVPSAMLANTKPPAGGRLAAKRLSGRTDTAWPVSPVVEAYWNFGIVGVVLTGLIYGLLSGFISRVMINNPTSTMMLVGYVSYVTTFSVGSDGFYKFFQVAIPLGVIYFLISIFFLMRRQLFSVGSNAY
ncbi:hypothetical protein OMB55_00004190 [gamma proteobacterium HIMB55]|nr:hypothetical protein OMB55_00004190 [gamma proteobacterium HIMB55]